MSTEKPKLRWPLDLQFIGSEGLIVLRDNEGIAKEPLVLSDQALPLLSALDGKRSCGELLQRFSPHGLTEAVFTQLLEALDSRGFLDTPITRAAWEAIEENFRVSETRRASHAGQVYPENPSELRQMLSSYLDSVSGNTPKSVEQGELVSLVAPHIDYHRGWKTYGSAYRLLDGAARPDVVFLIGTSHQPSKYLFHLTDKNFETPLGTIPCDRDIVEALTRAYGSNRCRADEILHRREHSLELQLPFLAHRYSAEGFPRIVPILVGSFQRYFDQGRLPIDDPEVGDFVLALAELLRSLSVAGSRVLFLAGVDLAHVGMHFGDPTCVSENGLDEIERRDQELLECVVRADHEALFSHIAEDCDARRVCGYPSLYSMFATMEHAGWRLEGRCLEYRQAVDTATDCIVTFASAYWRKLGNRVNHVHE